MGKSIININREIILQRRGNGSEAEIPYHAQIYRTAYSAVRYFCVHAVYFPGAEAQGDQKQKDPVRLKISIINKI